MEAYPCNGIVNKCNCGKTVLGPRKNDFVINKMAKLTKLMNLS